MRRYLTRDVANIKGSYCSGRDTRTVVLNRGNDCPSGHAFKSPVFQFLIRNNCRNSEIQFFFNKVRQPLNPLQINQPCMSYFKPIISRIYEAVYIFIAAISLSG